MAADGRGGSPLAHDCVREQICLTGRNGRWGRRVMSTQTRDTSTKSMEERLAQVGRKIDQAKAKADSASQEAKARVDRRIDDLRSRKAEFEARVRAAQAEEDLAGEEAFNELTLEVDEADAELDMLDAGARPSWSSRNF